LTRELIAKIAVEELEKREGGSGLGRGLEHCPSTLCQTLTATELMKRLIVL
jgi:hypothetical protein